MSSSVVEKIERWRHEHTLIFRELSEGTKPFYCDGCWEPISGPAYICEPCNFKLHKSCTELPSERVHPLHSHHLLTLKFLEFLDFAKKKEIYTCKGCGDLSSGFTFQCSYCHFNLDVKCGLSMVNNLCKHDDHDESQTSEEKERKASILLDSHKHGLYPCKVRKQFKLSCCSCNRIICGSAYICIVCNFFIHESCSETLQKVEHIFHPRHPLLLFVLEESDESEICKACTMSIKGMSLSCKDCKFHLHVSCADPTRVLKQNFHWQSLFGFEANVSSESFYCKKCGTCCQGFFYRCIDCNWNIHLECIGLPPPSSYSHEISNRGFLL